MRPFNPQARCRPFPPVEIGSPLEPLILPEAPVEATWGVAGLRHGLELIASDTARTASIASLLERCIPPVVSYLNSMWRLDPRTGGDMGMTAYHIAAFGYLRDVARSLNEPIVRCACGLTGAPQSVEASLVVTHASASAPFSVTEKGRVQVELTMRQLALYHESIVAHINEGRFGE